MSSGLIKVLLVFVTLQSSGRIRGKVSILGNSLLGQVLANWLTYAYKPMTKKKAEFIVILFGLCVT